MTTTPANVHANVNTNVNSNGVSTYENYVTLTEKALHKSRKSLDTRSLIQLAYGDDTAHIGGSDMLMGILNGVLDKIANETVLEDFNRYGTTSRSVVDEGKQHLQSQQQLEQQHQQQQQQSIIVKDDFTTVTSTTKSNDDDDNNERRMMKKTPQERLDKIDEAISLVAEWEARRDQLESLDAKSAREILDRNLLPEGVCTEDVIAHREYEGNVRAKKALEEELQQIQGEISALAKQQTEEQSKIREQLGKVEEVERELEATANVCAMITT